MYMLCMHPICCGFCKAIVIIALNRLYMLHRHFGGIDIQGMQSRSRILRSYRNKIVRIPRGKDRENLRHQMGETSREFTFLDRIPLARLVDLERSLQQV